MLARPDGSALWKQVVLPMRPPFPRSPTAASQGQPGFPGAASILKLSGSWAATSTAQPSTRLGRMQLTQGSLPAYSPTLGGEKAVLAASTPRSRVQPDTRGLQDGHRHLKFPDKAHGSQQTVPEWVATIDSQVCLDPDPTLLSR